MSPIEIYRFAGQYFLYGILCLFPVLLVGVHLLWLLMPSSLIKKYRKSPHFSETEVAVFEIYPGTLIFSIVVGWVICFPNRNGRNREMSGIRSDIPAWYEKFAKLFHYIVLLGWTGSLALAMAVAGVAQTMM